MKTWQKVLGALILVLILTDPALNLWDRISGNSAKENTFYINIPEDLVSNKSSNANQGDLSNESLKNQANELANSISGFVGDNNIKKYKLIPLFDNSTTNYNMTNRNDSLKEWSENTNRRVVFEAEVLKDFNQKYLGEIIRIRQEFLKRNITDELLEAFFWNPNYEWMQGIPASLHEMANKLSIISYLCSSSITLPNFH